MKKRNAFLLVLSSLFIVACNNAILNDQDFYQNLYDGSSFQLETELLVHHIADDSSDLWIKIPNRNLVFTRKNQDTSFSSLLEIKLVVYTEDVDGASFISDSTRSSILKLYNEEEHLTAKTRFKLRTGKNYRIEVQISDIKQALSENLTVKTEKKDSFGKDNFLFQNKEDGSILFGNYGHTNTEINIISPRNNGRTLNHLHYDKALGLPSPPFSDQNKTFTQSDYDEIDQIKIDSNGFFSCSLSAPLNLFSFDENQKKGSLLLTTGKFFPKVNGIKELGTTLRYISSRSEYRQITKSKYPKEKIDEFWLDCGGTPDHARDLIKIYYERVANANKYFTSYMEGWKSDRGLILIVFGQAQKIMKKGEVEVWYYGDPKDDETLAFEFNRNKTNYNDNHFELVRKSYYRTNWERMVVNWRNGKIYKN